MTKTIQEYLIVIRKNMEKRNLPAEFIDEFLENLNDQLQSMVEERMAADTQIPRSLIEMEVLDRCEDETKIVKTAVMEIERYKPDKTIKESKLTSFHFIPQICQPINQGWVWYRSKVLSRTSGFSLTLMILIAIPGLLTLFATFYFLLVGPVLDQYWNTLFYPLLMIPVVPVAILGLFLLPTGYLTDEIVVQFQHSFALSIIFFGTIFYLNYRFDLTKVVPSIVTSSIGFLSNLVSLRTHYLLLVDNDPIIEDFITDILFGSVFILSRLLLFGICLTFLLVFIKKGFRLLSSKEYGEDVNYKTI
ncbi:MAG: hypothetical protein ACFFDT_36550 [Candidatus Hodarchaeota archaeon]